MGFFCTKYHFFYFVIRFIPVCIPHAHFVFFSRRNCLSRKVRK